MTPPFFGSKIMNLLVFFDFEPKKFFRVPTLWGLYGAEGLYVKPQPPAFTTTLFCGILPHHHRIRRLQSELDYPPPYRGPLFQIFTTRGSL